MNKYIVLLVDNTETHVTASDISVGHNGSLMFFDDTIDGSEDSEYTHLLVAHFQPGSYQYVGLEGYVD